MLVVGVQGLFRSEVGLKESERGVIRHGTGQCGQLGLLRGLHWNIAVEGGSSFMSNRPRSDRNLVTLCPTGLVVTVT